MFGILGTGSLRSPGANVWALLRSREDDPCALCGADCVLMRGVELDPPVLCVRWRKDGVCLRGWENVAVEGTEATGGGVTTVGGLWVLWVGCALGGAGVS